MNEPAKVLMINHEKCTGCRRCEMVCSVYHDDVVNPSKARIKVEKWEWEGLYIPMTCRQCVDAPCMNVCPVKAIYRDEAQARVHVDHDICIGCRSCVAVCPFGAMNFNTDTKKVFKCDLCSGDPQCVRFCDMKAVDYLEPGKESVSKKREAAERIADSQKKATALLTD
jgi:anaerobic carbon-monoxide dehydrogenase iron sulfur subunit